VAGGAELIHLRVFGLACGYADCNDAARLADDAIHKLLLERDPAGGPGVGLATGTSMRAARSEAVAVVDK
jgi:hypothetical protein